MTLIDTHAHLDDKRLWKSLDEVINRAEKKGVSRIINVGINLKSSQRSIDISKKYENVFATVGVHPHDADEVPTDYIGSLKELTEKNKNQIVALGEMGLDFFKNYSPKEDQKRVFRAQLELAQEMGLPIVIHDRAASKATLEILKDFRNDLFGVFHCFSGDTEIARKVLDMGFYISFTGNISFEKASKLRKVVEFVPLDRMMVETDCPYMAPVPFRGKRNEPAYVRLVAETVAEIKGTDLEQVVNETGENATNLFKI